MISRVCERFGYTHTDATRDLAEPRAVTISRKIHSSVKTSSRSHRRRKIHNKVDFTIILYTH